MVPKGIPSEEFPQGRACVRNAVQVRKWRGFWHAHIQGTGVPGRQGELPLFRGRGLGNYQVWFLESQHQTFSWNKTSLRSHGGRRMEDGDAASCCPETAPTFPQPPPPSSRGQPIRPRSPAQLPTSQPAHPRPGSRAPHRTTSRALQYRELRGERDRYLRKRTGHSRSRRPTASPGRRRRCCRGRLLGRAKSGSRRGPGAAAACAARAPRAELS